MVALFAVSLALQPVAADAVVELCKPTLARKVDGEIATIDVSSRRMIGHRQIIEGAGAAAVVGHRKNPPLKTAGSSEPGRSADGAESSTCERLDRFSGASDRVQRAA